MQTAEADALQSLRAMLDKSRVVAFLGGAGVSTESGLPDFRSPGAAEETRRRYGYPPETLLSGEFFAENPAVFFTYYKEVLLQDAQPNAAHYALARLEARGRLNAVITQNIDELHIRAGSRRVYALHGSIAYNHCMLCGRRYDAAYIKNSPGIPRCACGGIVRPEVVLYGEPLDEYVWRGAKAAVMSADTLIVGGTSLAVQPAASLLEFFMGKRLILINKTPTPYDAQADLILRMPIAAALERATAVQQGCDSPPNDV